MEIILASGSPRRSELMTQIGIDFKVVVSDCDEHVSIRVPEEVVKELSERKASSVYEQLKYDRQNQGETFDDLYVIGSDTVVAVDGQILGKPSDRADAERMLNLLQGRGHYVYTGVTILGDNFKETFYERTEVIFYPMTDAEIKEYIGTREPMDKAGAYGIQGYCARYIKAIVGDYNTVVGLPVGKLYQVLKNFR